MSDYAHAREICEHHWVHAHQPDFPSGMYWVGQCSLCGDIDARSLAENICEIKRQARFEALMAAADEAERQSLRKWNIATRACHEWASRASWLRTEATR